MTVPPASPLRITVAGASSLLGKEIVELFSSSTLPVHELRLLDDAALEGTLTEAGGEPAVIHKLAPGSFEGVGLVFFAGLAEFTARHWAEAERAGAAVIDLSGGLAGVRTAVPSIPPLDTILGFTRRKASRLVRAPGAAAIAGATLCVALRSMPVRRIAATFFHPVSEHGQPGIDELEAQTASLLSFQPIAREVFDTQVAFNLLDRYGEACREPLGDVRARVARDISDYLAYRAPMPGIQVIQAPVFYGSAFSMFVEFDGAVPEDAMQKALAETGVQAGSDPPSNATAAGSAEINVTLRTDANLPMIWWIWGVVDNVRLAAQNAVRIAERICARDS